MKAFLTLLASLIVFNAYAQIEEIQQIISIQNIDVSDVPDIFCKDIINIKSGKSGNVVRALTTESDFPNNFSEIIAANLILT